jgi:hypothetical protein
MPRRLCFILNNLLSRFKRCLRFGKPSRPTKLLFVSGYSRKTVLNHKLVDVETNFLQKPYTLKQLSLKVRPPSLKTRTAKSSNPISRYNCGAWS